MAITVKTAAAGNAPATGMQKTPAPKTFVSGPDIVSNEKTGGGGYGQNHFTGSSSAPNDRQPMSPMAASLKAGQDDGENVLDALISGGVRALKGADDWQTRQVSNQPYPSAHGMEKRGVDSGSPGGVVPAKNGSPTGK